MRAEFSKLEGRLFCPDDSTSLVFEPDQFCCPTCSRRFAVLGEGIVELLPSVPVASLDRCNREYAIEYRRNVEKVLKVDESSVSWGAPESMPAKWVERRNRQVRSVSRLLEGRFDRTTLICDLSAGAGYYTFALASKFETVLHCDLSAENLSYAVWKARKAGVGNVVFVRSDYFAPPFRSSLDVAICLDTLIRGAEHERKLLKSIVNSTSPDGIAVVDFHNWWHNPIRRLGLLPQNFGANRSYTRAEVQTLLRDCGIMRFDFHPFHQEIGEKWIGESLFKTILPPTRLLYLFRGART